MSAERVPYPELDCALAMSKALGNLNFLVNRIKEEWNETHTTAQAIQDARSALMEAQKEYDKVLTLLRNANKVNV
jgi:predicted site-specific integrase-resolvase